MAVNEGLINTATRHQVFIERLKAGEAKHFHASISIAGKKAIAAVQGVEVQLLSDLTKQDLLALLASVREVYTAELTAVEEKHLTSLEEIAGYEVGFEARAIEQAVVAVSLTVPAAHKAYQEAIKRPLSANGALLTSFLSQWKHREIAAIQNVIRKGYADGWTNQQLVQAIRGSRARRYKDGIIGISTRNANTVVRTTVQHIASASRMVTWAANADIIMGYGWVSTLDSRTTPKCQGLDGKVFKLGEGPVPPIHLGCRSTTVADVKPEYKFIEDNATRASASGQVPAEQTYYSWLKKQPASFQDQALGKTRGKLFRDGGLSSERFAKLNLTRNFEPMTLEEMKAAEPSAFERAGIT